jgi:hypothetical protein
MHEPSSYRPDAIQVLIAEVPALLAEVVSETVNQEDDMRVVRRIVSARDLPAALREPVDVVITASATTDLGDPFQALLFGPTPTPIVTISLDGTRIDVYGRTTTRGRGLEGLTGLIREAVAGTRPRIGG